METSQAVLRLPSPRVTWASRVEWESWSDEGSAMCWYYACGPASSGRAGHAPGGRAATRHVPPDVYAETTSMKPVDRASIVIRQSLSVSLSLSLSLSVCLSPARCRLRARTDRTLVMRKSDTTDRLGSFHYDRGVLGSESRETIIICSFPTDSCKFSTKVIKSSICS